VTNEKKALFGNLPLCSAGTPMSPKPSADLNATDLRDARCIPRCRFASSRSCRPFRLVGDVLSSIEACSIEPVTARITPDGRQQQRSGGLA
jgi:hypothetical protein